MEIEFDNAKRNKTLRERGLDFADVAKFDWDNALTVKDARNNYGETRFISVGYIDDRLCVVAWTYRGENLRVISLRKANKREIRQYEKT